IALATLHAHAADDSASPATFAGIPVPPDSADWAAELPKHLPAAFRFPLVTLNHKELERTRPDPARGIAGSVKYELSLANAAREQLRTTLTLVRDGPTSTSPCWRLAAFDILHGNSG